MWEGFHLPNLLWCYPQVQIDPKIGTYVPILHASYGMLFSVRPFLRVRGKGLGDRGSGFASLKVRLH